MKSNNGCYGSLRPFKDREMLVKVREIVVNLKGPRDLGQRSERYWSNTIIKVTNISRTFFANISRTFFANISRTFLTNFSWTFLLTICTKLRPQYLSILLWREISQDITKLILLLKIWRNKIRFIFASSSHGGRFKQTHNP